MTDSKPVYHFISHSHWDREWYKPFETFRLDLVEMIHALLEIFQTNPEYKHFTLDGQTIVLEDFAEIAPERAGELRELIQDGRISIGPWYVLPDEFLISGESTVRNLLFGRKAAEPYGPVMQIGYIPDSFGHIAMMPAILRGFDIDTAIVYRGFGGETGQETSEYQWQSPDGSRVLMIHLPPNGYGDAYIGSENKEAYIRKAAELKEILDARATTPHRLCMNGGDHHFPESYLPEALRVMNESHAGAFIHSSLPTFVASVKSSLEKKPVTLKNIEGELRWGYRYAFAVQSGIYSSRIYLKLSNHACEKLLTRYAEPLAIWADLAGRDNLDSMIRQAWKLLLQNHPHDSICGCSVDSVHREMMSRFQKCSQIGDAIIEKSLQSLFPNHHSDSEHILVFNPIPRTANRPVAVAIEFLRQKILVGLNPNHRAEPAAELVSGFRLKDSEGREVPFQITAHAEDGHGLRYSNYSYPSKYLVERFHLLFDARDLPGLGFGLFSVERADSYPEYTSSLRFGDNWLENESLRIEVHPDGSLDILEKRSNQWLRKVHVFEDGGDAGDEYNYSYPAKDNIVTSEGNAAAIELIEAGPLRAVLEIRQSLEIPAGVDRTGRSRSRETVAMKLSTRIALYHNQPWVECETTIHNQADDHRLRVLFPSALKGNSSHADSQFCITKRAHKPVTNPQDYSIELPSATHPMQRAVTIHDTENGLTLAAAGLPEYELKAEEPGTLALTLLRCVGRLSGGDLLTRPGGESGWVTEAPEAQCHGIHTCRYAIIPHPAADFASYSWLNEQIEAFLFPGHAYSCSGDAVTAYDKFGLALAPASLVFSAFKPAEDCNGQILRFYNPTSEKASGTLKSKTPFSRVMRCQLNERDLEAVTLTNPTTVDFVARPFEIISFRLDFEKAPGENNLESAIHS